MKIRLLIAASALAMSLAAAGTASAVVLPPVTTACSGSDFSGASIQACQGFFGGNLLNSANTAVDQLALANLGFTWNGSTVVEKLEGLGGANPTFSPTLAGISYIGVHWGNGGDSPGGTAFYRINAGAGLSTLTLNVPFQATSNLWVFGTGAGGVPEPASWAMMILGMGGVGAALRNRRRLPMALA